MATFKAASPDVHDLLEKVLKECYPQLWDFTQEHTNPLRFDLLMVHADLDANGEPVGPPLCHHGRTAGAVISAVPKAQRALGLADVLIKFDGDMWDSQEMTLARKEALMDHELCHLELITQEGTPKRDDFGRLRFRMKSHDYEFGWFMAVAKRRGNDSFEVTQAHQMHRAHGQILFDFQGELSLPTVTMPTSGGAGVAKAHGFTVVTGGKGEIPEGNLLWETMDPVQREAAQDAFQDRLDLTASFRFEGVRCAGMFVLGEGELAAYARADDTGGAGDLPGGHPPASETPAKAKKRATTKRAASKN